MINVNCVADHFFEKYNNGINTLYNIFFKKNNLMSLTDFKSNLRLEILKSIDHEFIKGNFDNLDSSLFYVANEFCKLKNKELNIIQKNIEYICPGCLFLNKTSILNGSNTFSCKVCLSSLKKEKDLKKILLYSTFSDHNKNGYHCNDCNRFIPYPIDNIKKISCPYFDCCFVGDISSLKRMIHPRINATSIITDNIISSQNNENNLNVKILKEIINSQKNVVEFSSSNLMLKQKLLAYQAIYNLLDQFPTEMTNYLLNDSRSGGFQHKIFQEYVMLLEKSLPFIVKIKKTSHKIESLLDVNLSIFDGISNFNSIINDKLIIKNNTSEFYIGGRKASYAKPYYIGKLLSITDKKNNESLNHNIVDYSFSKIKMKDVKPGTEVQVTHLRVPPHYQMGAMVYINRARKLIVDQTKNFLKENV